MGDTNPIELFQKARKIYSSLFPDKEPDTPQESREPRKAGSDGEKSGFRDYLKRIPIIGSLFADNATKEKAEATREGFEKERSGFFGEVWESVLSRYFPNISKGLDGLSAIGVTKTDAEVVPWQNEFEAITAFSLLVPDFLLKYITDPIAKSAVFQKIIENWPLTGDLAEKIKKDKNPDDVISALRIIHQDLFITGKVSLDQVRAWMK